MRCPRLAWSSFGCRPWHHWCSVWRALAPRLAGGGVDLGLRIAPVSANLTRAPRARTILRKKKKTQWWTCPVDLRCGAARDLPRLRADDGRHSVRCSSLCAGCCSRFINCWMTEETERRQPDCLKQPSRGRLVAVGCSHLQRLCSVACGG